MTTAIQLRDVILQGEITPDTKQSEALLVLQSMSDELIATSSFSQVSVNNDIKDEKSFFSFFKKEVTTSTNSQSSLPKAVKGLYLWGDVGRGKTWLMDQFYNYLPLTEKRRVHFHAFMLEVHKKLQDLPSQPDPLALVGEQMAKEIRVLCLDEFHVMDIADAVILHGLLKALFEQGVTVVTTSNRQPDDLYKNGSHRERFLPAIELMKRYTQVFHLSELVDYRLLRNTRKNVFFIPHNESTNQHLKKFFDDVSGADMSDKKTIKILGRNIPVLLSAKGCVWFDFDTLCKGMRSNSDYIQIAQRYDTVILSEIPELHEGEEGPARRFLNLIDAFYDQHVFLILSSYVELKDIYTGSLLVFEFERALSRLHEMQSESWWLKHAS